jgi:protein involved in polysaccharide export with SLBB domain
MSSPVFLAALIMAMCTVGLPSANLQAQGGSDVAHRVAAQVIRVGDRIELKFLRDQELNAALTVNERGEAVFPKLGSIDLDSITIGALRDTLVSRYKEFLRAPELEVSVSRRVVVLGEVKNPDVYYLDATSSVRDAIAKAGGALPTANKGKVIIARGGQRIRAKRWETSETQENDLQSGDQVIVARQNWLVLNALPVISTSVIVIGLIRSLK